MPASFANRLAIALMAAWITGSGLAGETGNGKDTAPAAANNHAGVVVTDGVILCFADGAKEGIISHCQIEGKKLWVDAVRRGDKTRQVRVTSYVGSQGTLTPVKLAWPEIADGTMTWNLAVKRDGDVVSVILPWNRVRIGDLMDVNEGEGTAAAIRKKLGVDSGADANLPVLYTNHPQRFVRLKMTGP